MTEQTSKWSGHSKRLDEKRGSLLGGNAEARKGVFCSQGTNMSNDFLFQEKKDIVLWHKTC